MFALFFSLYVAMFWGSWTNFSNSQILNALQDNLNIVGELITSIFNDGASAVTNFGDVLINTSMANSAVPNWISLVSFVLALITSIGIVVVAVKGIKRLFTVFFYGVR